MQNFSGSQRENYTHNTKPLGETVIFGSSLNEIFYLRVIFWGGCSLPLLAKIFLKVGAEKEEGVVKEEGKNRERKIASTLVIKAERGQESHDACS